MQRLSLPTSLLPKKLLSFNHIAIFTLNFRYEKDYEWKSLADVGYRLFRHYWVISIQLDLKPTASCALTLIMLVPTRLVAIGLVTSQYQHCQSINLLEQREADSVLQQYTLEQLLKYFFAAGHFSYARYITQYLLEFRNLPPGIKKDFEEGQ